MFFGGRKKEEKKKEKRRPESTGTNKTNRKHGEFQDLSEQGDDSMLTIDYGHGQDGGVGGGGGQNVEAGNPGGNEHGNIKFKTVKNDDNKTGLAARGNYYGKLAGHTKKSRFVVSGGVGGCF